MFLIIASLALSASWIVWTWLYTAHRKPVPPSWTKNEPATALGVVVWVVLLATGIGAFVAACAAPVATLGQLTILSAIATVSAPVLAWFLTRYLRASPTVPNPNGAVLT